MVLRRDLDDLRAHLRLVIHAEADHATTGSEAREKTGKRIVGIDDGHAIGG